MKVLKIILIVLVVIIGGIAIWLSTMDGKFDVSRSAFIDATPEAVYAEVSDFKTWPEWGSWFEKDSTMKVTFGDVSQGQGAEYSWIGENSGAGKMTIVKAEPNSSMQTEITFEGMGSSSGFWTFVEKDGGTEVTWSMRGELPFYVSFMAEQMDASVGPDFEAGLANLKERLESRAPALDISVVELKPTAMFYMHHEITWEEMSSDLFGNSYGEIANYLGEDASLMTGAPLAVIHEWNEVDKTTVMDIAMPNASEKTGNDVVLKGMTPSGKMLKAVHIGSYDSSGETHYLIDDYILKNGLEMNGSVMEVYVVGPATEPDTANWVTEIYYPIK